MKSPALPVFILQIKTGEANFPQQNLNVQLMPKGAYTADFTTIQLLASLYLVLAFSPYVGILAAYIVYEKEKKIKEGMRMMGMRDSAFW